MSGPQWENDPVWEYQKSNVPPEYHEAILSPTPLTNSLPNGRGDTNDTSEYLSSILLTQDPKQLYNDSTSEDNFSIKQAKADRKKKRRVTDYPPVKSHSLHEYGITSSVSKSRPAKKSKPRKQAPPSNTKSRYEPTMKKSYPVPINYCSASFSRGKPFCPDCCLKPCIMRVHHTELSMYCTQMEVCLVKPKNYIERKAKEFIQKKVIDYFGESYQNNYPPGGVPACFYRKIQTHIESDVESGDESEDEYDYCVIPRPGGGMTLL